MPEICASSAYKIMQNVRFLFYERCAKLNVHHGLYYHVRLQIYIKYPPCKNTNFALMKCSMHTIKCEKKGTKMSPEHASLNSNLFRLCCCDTLDTKKAFLQKKKLDTYDVWLR